MTVIDRDPETRPEIRQEIQTERLRLRAPQPQDAAAIGRLASDYAVCSMTTRMPYPYLPSDARAFVAQTQAQDRSRDNTFVILHKDAVVIGALGFHRGGTGPLEMGYWLGRPYWGKGFATEATRGALAWAADDWGRRQVSSGHFTDNEASARVLIKAGFLYTGEVQRRVSRARGEVALTRMMVWLA